MTDELSWANGDTAVLSLPWRNESFLASGLWLLLWLPLQDPQQTVDFSLKFSYVASTSCSLLMLWLIRRKKIPHKNFWWTDFGGIDADIPPSLGPCTPLTSNDEQTTEYLLVFGKLYGKALSQIWAQLLLSTLISATYKLCSSTVASPI